MSRRPLPMMNRAASRLLSLLAVVPLAVAAMAGTLTIKAPTAGAFVGRSGVLRFQLTGARVEATVKVALATPGGGVTRIEQKFTPTDGGVVDSSIPLSFSDSSPTGDYTATVSVEEPGNPYADKSVTFKVDVVAPKLTSVSPINGGFVKGIVRIRARIQETNLQGWEVRVDNQLIPNNTGTTPDVAVNYDTTGIPRDGLRTISIKATDLAGNVTNREINVTLDRIKPSLTIAYPLASTSLLKNQTVSVIVDVVDASSSSVDATGIDVLARGLDGTLLGRIARISVSPSGQTSLRWIGRIRPNSPLPTRFKIVATATDRAGNVGTPQEVVVSIR